MPCAEPLPFFVKARLWRFNASGVQQGSPFQIDPLQGDTQVYDLAIGAGNIFIIWGPFSANVQTYDLSNSRTPSEDFVASLIVPNNISFNGTHLVQFTGGSLIFYGDTPFVQPEPPVVPVSYQQFIGFEGWTEDRDFIKITGDELTVKRRNVRTLISTTTREVDLSSQVTIVNQLDSWTLIPQDTIPDAEVGDIIAPSVPDVEEPAVGDYPESDRFSIIGFRTVGGKEILRQAILAERGSS